MSRLSTARRTFLKQLARCGAGLAVLTGSKTGFANSSVVLTNIRIAEADSGYTRVVFDLSKNIKHNIFSLIDPHRVVIDLADTRESHAFELKQQPTNILQSIRSAKQPNGQLRVVFDLKVKAVRPRSFVLPPEGDADYRLVVDLRAADLNPTPIVTSQQKQRQQKKTFVIALDPGHGGRDPGAIGKQGTREKDVALAVARKMQSMINHTAGYRAVLTRTGDQFIALRQRVKKAREVQADLFISLHADSFRNSKAKGASVYALSLNGASSEAARWLAQKENKSDLIGGISLDDRDDMIASVLLGMSQESTILDSLKLGSDVLHHLEKVSRVNNKQVQQAGFAVLKAPDVPSILVEMAFLSNPAEERKLRDKKYQKRLATAIFAGIKSHLKQYPV